jgi:hypothetical protein
MLLGTRRDTYGREAYTRADRPRYARSIMSGHLLNQRKEWLSRAYVTAVAATAGYSTQVVQDDFFGADAQVRDGAVLVEFQLKATASPILADDALKYDLDVPTYNKLRDAVRSAPGYLLVLVLPEDPIDWLAHSAEELAMRHCGYWLDLTGMPPTNNTSTIRLELPLANKMTVEKLQHIMLLARRRLES